MPFPYSFPIEFGDAKAQKDEQLSSYGDVINRWGLDIGYDSGVNTKSKTSYGSVARRYKYPSDYQED